MDKHERENDKSLRIDKDTQINVVLSNPAAGEGVIDLGHVIHNFKMLRRTYVWVLLLCFVACICAALLWYQATQPPLSVSSVVTLDYEIPNPLLDPLKNEDYTPSLLEDETIPHNIPVPDLTAPDGSELDLGQISSSYVLRSALLGMELSQPVTLANLSDNIRVQKILTDESRRLQEVATGMIQEKNSSAYSQIKNMELTYENQFVVTLTNGFGDEDSRVKTYLSSNELHLILDRILDAYNTYLASTYSDASLPNNEFSVIDTETLDLPESLDMLRTAIDNLCGYCNEKSDTIRNYRSWRTGFSLNDLVNHMEKVKSIDVDYLYSCVLANNIAKDPEAMKVSFEYQLRSAQNALDQINEIIVNNQRTLDGYKNDQIFVSMQDSDTTKSTTASTNYYNKLVLEQADNYSTAAKLGAEIANLRDRISHMDATGEAVDIQPYSEELERILASCRDCYSMVEAQMNEITTSPFFTTFSEHSTAEETSKTFIEGASKKIVIGAFFGIVLGFGLWFFAALAPELSSGRKRESNDAEEVEEQ